MHTAEITAIILAAGFSRRMEGKDKLLLPFRGKALLTHTLQLVAGLPFARRLLVSTPNRLDIVELPDNMHAVLNFHPERGQSESVRLGVEAAPATGAYLFFTGDQPLLNAKAIRPLLEQADDCHIIYPQVVGRPASPTLFPARFRGDLLALSGDTGGRAVRAAHPDACRPVEVHNQDGFYDIDTEEDYHRLLKEYD